MSSTRLLAAVLAVLVLPASAQAQFGWVKKKVDKAASILDDSYKRTTAPVRKGYSIAYGQIRKPFESAKKEFNNSIPEPVRAAYKQEVERFLRPTLGAVQDVSLGHKGPVEGAVGLGRDMLRATEAALKEPYLRKLYLTARVASKPLPPELVAVLQKHWGQVTGRTLHVGNDGARVVVSDWLVDTLTLGGGFDSITLYDVIVVREIDNSVEGIGLFAHELVHVAQYKAIGFEPFIALYLKNCAVSGYEDAAQEREANQVQMKIQARLDKPAQKSVLHRGAVQWEHGRTSVENIARMTVMSGGGGEVTDNVVLVAASLIAAQSPPRKQDVEQLLTIVMGSEAVSDAALAQVFRTLVFGGAARVCNRQDVLNWGRMAVSANPKEPMNWYCMAMCSFAAQDAQNEYDALMTLGCLVVAEEQGNGMTPRLQWACCQLDRAALLASFLGGKHSGPYDIRMPFIILAEVGLRLPANAWTDAVMFNYLRQASGIDQAVRRMDVWHFRLLDVCSQACLTVAPRAIMPGNIQLLQQAHLLATTALKDLGAPDADRTGLDADYPAQMSARKAAIEKLLGLR